MALTPLKSLSNVPKFGVATIVHADPFQCSASVWSSPAALSESPTAQMSAGPITDVLMRKLAPRAFGLATVWNWPSQLGRLETVGVTLMRPLGMFRTALIAPD